MQVINDHIKNKAFSKLYLLYGEENYLKKSYKEKLRNAFIPEEYWTIAADVKNATKHKFQLKLVKYANKKAPIPIKNSGSIIFSFLIYISPKILYFLIRITDSTIFSIIVR